MEEQKISDAFLRLVKIMDELWEKCPWDKKQTIESLNYSFSRLKKFTERLPAEDPDLLSR